MKKRDFKGKKLARLGREIQIFKSGFTQTDSH